jgi:dihydrofolate reductase
MAGFWPTPEAIKTDPIVAAGMNKSEKIVFSRTLQKADWNNTRLVKDDMLGEVRRLKQGAGKELTVLGSGSIVAQLAEEGLIDEYEILLNPVVLGKGKTMFEGLKKRLALKLVSTRTFGNGNVLLTYVRHHDALVLLVSYRSNSTQNGNNILPRKARRHKIQP